MKGISENTESDRPKLPAEFVEMIRSYGAPWGETLLSALSGSNSPVSVRVNRRKGFEVPADADPVPWDPSGFYLDKRPFFAADPLWHAGAYYVQDASSMAVSYAVRKAVEILGNQPLLYLDACAAPGGKALGAIDSLPAGSFAIVNEADRHRVNILNENIGKAGVTNVAVTRADARQYESLEECFDIITADVPCSGEGMMRKEEEAVRQWSLTLIGECATLQAEILKALWQSLKPGGILIYSTCTFNRLENEDNIRLMVDEFGAESLPLNLDKFPGVAPGLEPQLFCYRFVPGEVKGEGLFVAALRKPGIYRPGYNKDILKRIGKIAKVIRAGIPAPSTKGRDLVPSYEAVMSHSPEVVALPCYELDRLQSLRYLHGEALTAEAQPMPKGYVVVTYCGTPLGLVKSMGHRANNLYPDFLRLRLDPSRPEFSEKPSVLEK